MHTDSITPALLRSSVIAVPPLARNQQLELCSQENQKIIHHLENGGVTTLLYGGNAALYHTAPSEYPQLLQMLQNLAGENTWVIPSVGPAYGVMMDQAEMLRDFDFPTAMVLPQKDVATSAGSASAVRRFVEKWGKPAVLYLKHGSFFDIADVRSLMNDQLISAIKYAVVLDDPAQDDYLQALIDAVGTERIVSGIGEQPAIVHLRDFGLTGFTSGCVCVAPKLSMTMMRAIHNQDYDQAETIRQTFQPLEDLRNGIHPIRVLHSAVAGAGIADTGPILPLLSEVSAEQAEQIAEAAKELLAKETA